MSLSHFFKLATRDVAIDLGCVAVVANHGLMDAALIDRLHTAGLRALVYTVNDAARAQALIDDGIDGIITDAVDRVGVGSSNARGTGR